MFEGDMINIAKNIFDSSSHLLLQFFCTAVIFNIVPETLNIYSSFSSFWFANFI